MKIINLTSNKIFSNSMWMILEKFLGAFGVIFINAYMAKYIGPDNFGRLAFATSLFFLVQTFSWFGAQNVLFKVFSKNENSGIALSIYTQNFRRLIFIVTSIFSLSYLWFFSDFLTFVFGIANCLASYYLVMDIYSIHNNAMLKSSINALTNILGLFLGFLIRYVLVYYEASVYLMALPIVIIAAIPYFIRKYYFNVNKEFIKNKKFVSKYNKYIYKTGGALVLSTLSIAIYTQISNIFIANKLNYYDLGLYNVAMTLGASWGFINAAIITSFFSKIYSEKKIEKELGYIGKLTWIIIFIGSIIFILSTILSEWFIDLLFGDDFINAAKLIPIIVVGSTISGLSTIAYRYMIKINAYRYLSIKMLILSILSIIFSYIFIDNWGIYGASICFVLVEFIALTVSNYFYKSGVVFKQHLKVFNIFNIPNFFR